MLKRLLKSVVVRIEYILVAKLIARKPNLKVVAVVGSVGKSGTKKAIASVLDQKYSVAWQDGNYNDITTVPLVFFDLKLPSLLSPFGWLKVFIKMNKKIKDYPHDVVVLELGTDGVGQIAEFGKYLKLDIAVVTHISEEHMENFTDVQSVASEELSVQDFTKELIVDVSSAKRFESLIKKDFKTFGPDDRADAYFVTEGRNVNIFIGNRVLACQTNLTGKHQMNGLSAGALVAKHLGLEDSQIENGVSSVLPMPGRMQRLKGKDGSLVIDDTYNASPDAVVQALNYIDELDQAKKIVVIGNMNELGKFSADAHRAVGELIASKDFSEVLTIGPDANQYIQEAMKASGKKNTKSFNTPYEVGEYLADKDLKDTALLFKGSQNGVYLEEAIKYILTDKDDTMSLVRQSKDWINKKKKSFKIK